jgi:hypothetical protein
LLVVVDLPAFEPSGMDTVAPEMAVPSAVSMTCPLTDNVVGVGVGDGDVVLLFPPPQATAATSNPGIHTRFKMALSTQSQGAPPCSLTTY